MKIINTKNTVRKLEIEFENDTEFLEFIKLLACSSKLQSSKIYSWWGKQHESIITNEELDEQYNNL
jgi:membrane-bound inhibitor of C-type lysozyme